MIQLADSPLSLLDTPATEWRELFADADLEPYRGDQVANWVFARNVFDFEEMTNLPRPLRADLAVRYSVMPPAVDRTFASVDGSRRYLLAVPGGDSVEAVFMPYPKRTTLCISSQVGCRFACTFCKTGEAGLTRSLRPGEIIGQVLRLRAETDSAAQRLNVVFMGQGEPLDNSEAVVAAVLSMQDERGLGLSWRRITVSTVGLVPAIRRLGRLGAARPRLAVSLNATTDALRSELMPINRKYPIAQLLAALRALDWRPREKVTFEYVLLRDVNDSEQDAARLARLVHGLPAKVNLIPWNPVDAMPYDRPSPATIERFRRAARRRGVDALVRYSRGADIGAACGQLQSRVAASGQAKASPATDC